MTRISGRPFLDVGTGFLERAIQLNVISVETKVALCNLGAKKIVQVLVP